MINKLLATGLLLLSSALNANTLTSVNDAHSLLDSLQDELEMEYVAYDHFMADDLSDILGTTTIVDWYEAPHDPFRFFIENKFTQSDKLYIKEIKCVFTYVDVFGQPDGTGSNGGTFRTFPTKTAMLPARESKCTRKFNCEYVVGVDGYDEAERPFRTNLDLDNISGLDAKNMCLTHARIKVKG